MRFARETESHVVTLKRGKVKSLLTNLFEFEKKMKKNVFSASCEPELYISPFNCKAGKKDFLRLEAIMKQQ